MTKQNMTVLKYPHHPPKAGERVRGCRQAQIRTDGLKLSGKFIPRSRGKVQH